MSSLANHTHTTSSQTTPSTTALSSAKKLRIAIIAHSLYPIAQPYAGGLEKMTHLICDELVDLGHEVLLYAHKDSETKATLIPLLTREEFDTLVSENGHKALSMGRNELFQYLTYQLALRDIIARYEHGEIDIVHNHSLHHIPMMTGQAFGSRFFTTFHTPIFPDLNIALLTLSRGTSTQFTSVSHYQQRLFSEFVPSKVVYNGIEVDEFKANVAPIKEEVYFWYGRICPEKGTHLAMQYCKEANKKLIIAGPKSNQGYFDEQVAPLLREDEENGSAKRFEYVGHLTKSEINDYLTQATALLFTSTWDEPYGLTLAESLACGTPVLGFDVGASAEIVTPTTGIIVAKEDKQAFIKGFDNIKNISRQACRDRAVQFCSASAMVEDYLNLYHQTLDSSNDLQSFTDGEASLKREPLLTSHGSDLRTDSTQIMASHTDIDGRDQHPVHKSPISKPSNSGSPVNTIRE